MSGQLEEKKGGRGNREGEGMTNRIKKDAEGGEGVWTKGKKTVESDRQFI